MNKTHRLIWNDLTCTWVAVSERTRARGKRSSGALLLGAAGRAAQVNFNQPGAPHLRDPLDQRDRGGPCRVFGTDGDLARGQ